MNTLLSRITVDPEICHGKPCIRGMRHPVENLLELMSSGMTPEEILSDYPELEPDDLRAVHAYAGKIASNKKAPAGGNVKFLVDVHFPRKTCAWLASCGCDAMHASALPSGFQTRDFELARYADRAQRVVMTKDADFIDSHLIRGEPRKLLLLSVGNMRNPLLKELLRSNLADIAVAFETNSFVELGLDGVILRG